MKKTLERGFTLIELLVVIAIIGILAAVVIGSLGDARQSGQDASMKQSMSGIRSQAEISYNNNSFSYDDVCTADTNVTQALAAIVDAASEVTTAATVNGVSATDTVTCNDSATGWAVIAPLNANDNYWCVDSEGFAGEVSTVGAAGDALDAATDVSCNA